MRLFALCTALVLMRGSYPARADDFESAGVKIHYTVSGQGDPVLLVHGLYSSALMNWDLPGITKELALHYPVIAPDLRGHGQSGKPAGEAAYGTQMVEDMVRLMDHLGIKKARMAGYSMGGMIVMKLLVLHPDRVETAVLGGMGWLKQSSPLQRVWERMSPPNLGGTPAACVNAIAQLAVTADEVRAIKTPVTVIVGDRDPCRRLYVAPLQTIRPDWPVRIIAGAGHIECVGKPEFKTELEKALAGGGG
jgi:pimeloyl-ACP methyl ester carboxylesterase